MTTTHRFPARLTGLCLLLLAVLIAMPFAPSVGAQEAKAAPTVRFAHVVSGGGPIDIYVDNQLLVKQLAFGTVTEYATLTPGDHQLQVVETGKDPSTALINTTLSSDAGSATNVLIGGQGDQLDARSYPVDISGLDPGQTRMRFIQASPDTGKVEIQLTSLSNVDNAASVGNTTTGNTANGSGSVSDLSSTPSTDYQTLVAGTYDIVVRDAGSDQAMVAAPSIDLSSGNVYDVVVLGQLATNNLTLLPLSTLVSSPCGEVLGIGNANDACVRFVHTSPDAGNLDIYVNGTKVVDAISYGTVTEFAVLGTDSQQIQVVPAGQPLQNPLLDETVDPSAGYAYLVSILGIAAQDDNDNNNLRLLQDQVDLSTLPPGQTRLRLINAVPDTGALTVTRTGGADLFSATKFGDVTDYTTVNVGTTDLAATGDNDQIVSNATGVALTEGTVNDVFIIGLTSTNTVQFLIAPAPAEVRTGAQGTPLAVSPVAASTSTPSVVSAASVTAVGEGAGGQTTPTPVGAAPLTPVLTPESTATPTPATTPTPTS